MAAATILSSNLHATLTLSTISRITENACKPDKGRKTSIGVSTEGPNAKGAQQTLSGSISKYTPEAHCALIAMRCAVNTPLMNDLGAVTSIMRTKMVKGPKGKASGKGKSNDIVIDSD
ncbi:hypothetical protein EV424DRAFT_1352282 [Suillus variegatus]|nr:hypothetical protein EV424DRAFT_1352282 [Suillus variegatus]